MESEKIIIKVTSDFPGLFSNIQKYSDFINYFVAKQTDQGFYLEIVPDGIIYFYKNFEVFRAVNQTHAQNKKPRGRRTEAQKMEPNLLLSNVVHPDEYPSCGISLLFKTYQGDVRSIRPIAKSHFESLHQDEVKTSVLEDDRLRVCFTSFRALYNYTNAISNLFNGLIEEYEKTTSEDIQIK